MDINISRDPEALGVNAGTAAADLIRNTIAENGSANIIMATGTSQFQTLQTLIAAEGIDWSKVVMFHLDEYIGIPVSHPASFRKYLQERFLAMVPALKGAYLINGEENPEKECEMLSNLILKYPIDVALVGIGENGHLAFNDPPADFDTVTPYIVVELDQPCRQQQYSEGWFKTLEDVPKRAISMSIKQVMKSKNIIGSVPDERKAPAVKNTVEQKVSNIYPASILQLHSACTIFLDKASASLLSS
ncbi:MAG: glucosamine-6-phosphate deaminase [Flavitalea sp.]